MQRIKHLNKYVCLSVALDITERKIADEKIKESQLQLKSIFDNSTNGFILLDPDGFVKAFNTNAKISIELNVGTELEIEKSIYFCGAGKGISF